MTLEDVQKAISKALVDLRHDLGYSVPKMAELLMISENSLRSYEHGNRIPRADDFLFFFILANADPVKKIRQAVHPHKYKNDADIMEKRRAIIEYFENASDDEIYQMHYVMFAETGSEFTARLMKQAVEDHLPLRDKIAHAKDVMHDFRMAQLLGDLVNPELIMPDVKLIVEAIRVCQEALEQNQKSYTTLKGNLNE